MKKYHLEGKSMFKNMKIRNKLMLGFGLLMVITAVITVVAAINMNRMNSEATYAIGGPYVRYSLMRDIEVHMMDARRTMNRISMNGGVIPPDNADNDIQEGNFRIIQGNVEDVLEKYRDSLRNDPGMDDDYREYRIDRVDMLDAALQDYWGAIRDVIAASRAGNLNAAIQITRDAGTLVSNAYYHMDYLMAVSANYMNQLVDDLNTTATDSLYLLVGLTIVGIVLGVIAAILIVKSVAGPVAKIGALVNDVAHGNVNVNIDRSRVGKDEVGMLTRDVYELIDVIRHMIDDLSKMTHEFTVNGDIEYRADTSKYQNAFKDLMERCNGMLQAQMNEVLPAIKAMNSMAEGDFNVTIKDLPGKKAILPQSIRSIAAKLADVYNSISHLATQASEGNLNVQLDASKFQGNWASMLNNLNNLVVAIATPIAAVEKALTFMRDGNFEDARIDQEFKGTFNNLRLALNQTEEMTLEYISEIADTLTKMSAGDYTVSISRDYVGSYAPIKS
ncbi:MAG: MCP four helix bundle domain-containing protein, partial [Defluviitaleaceae bacterium]|nr:MCP four helix bundle domain-containing protein [Defluviitaleaceae bacterium]